ncbi:MAG: hypothetical protein KF799_03120 [Bdellovibrionales bacterium]|nr:hypothetical protein [Bdellovibrionales bacterium]
MGRLQNIIFLLIVGLAPAAHAGWGLSLATGGFQGAESAGAIRDWNGRHALEFGLGRYSYDGNNEAQVNFGYRYTPFTLHYKGAGWSPLGMGVTAVYALNQSEYFTKSPSKYPGQGYYEQTGIRLGLEASTQVMGWNDRIRLLYKVVFMDTGITTLINNDGKHIENFFSSGLALQFFF